MTGFTSQDYSNISVLRSSARTVQELNDLARHSLSQTLTEQDFEISENLVDQLSFGFFGRLQIMICSLCCCGGSQKMIADKVAQLISPLLGAITPEVAARNAGRPASDATVPPAARSSRRIEIQARAADPVSAAAARTPVVPAGRAAPEPTSEEIQARRGEARARTNARRQARAERAIASKTLVAPAATPASESRSVTPASPAATCDFRKPVKLLFEGERSAQDVGFVDLEGVLRIRHRQGMLFINSKVTIDGAEIEVQDNPTLMQTFELVSAEANERTAKMANVRSQGSNGTGTFVLANEVAAAARRRAQA